jgi:hypothetical protein
MSMNPTAQVSSRQKCRGYLIGTLLVGFSLLPTLVTANAFAREIDPKASVANTPVTSQPSPASPTATDERYDWAVLHVGYRPRLRTFGGLATLALVDGDAERFYGGLRFSFAKDSVDKFYGVLQTTLGYAKAESFVGVVQLGPVLKTKESLAGLQLGIVSVADRKFEGLLQVGVVIQIGKSMYSTYKGSICHKPESDFAGLAQIGFAVSTRGRFLGLAQIGGFLWTGDVMYAPLQVGIIAGAVEFNGLLQLGLFSGASTLRGLGVGAFNGAERVAGAQVGVVTLAMKEHNGVQFGLLNLVTSGTENGVQVGMVNSTNHIRGVQIGLFNFATKLQGVQIGLVNRAARGGILPWSALLNVGFGDD